MDEKMIFFFADNSKAISALYATHTHNPNHSAGIDIHYYSCFSYMDICDINTTKRPLS